MFCNSDADADVSADADAEISKWPCISDKNHSDFKLCQKVIILKV